MMYSLDQNRFIPASAGNTPVSCSSPCPTPVHPRERGEHFQVAPRPSSSIGSSPRARGTRHRRRRHDAAARFIPASAGNTRTKLGAARLRSVHPRERGEHGRFVLAGHRHDGSSPRARGTPELDVTRDTVARFIPASAGNTSSSSVFMATSPVHPRERGEHLLDGVEVGRRAGSSPRARGTRWGGPCRSARPRFIPASAGNTWGRRRDRSARPVHPRQRGEHPPRPMLSPASPGSSPRARGTPCRLSGALGPVRFIPASAGNTPITSTRPCGDAVHPRERGEHALTLQLLMPAGGSSPRARGTR